jgi:hypothetical protein
VFSVTAKVAVPNSNPVTLTDQQQYVVTNHGFTYVLRETNNLTTNGMVNYKVLPSAYRNQAGFTKTRLLAEGDTGAQPHATCRGVAALDDEAAVLAWQGTDPFYNYVPFQKTSAGLEDDPALWLAAIKNRTGLDLAAVTDVAAACAGLGGTYRAADATMTTTTSLASGTIEEATVPLEAKIGELEAAAASQTTVLAGSQTRAATAENEVKRLLALNTELKLALPVTKVRGAQFVKSGMNATISGPPLRALTVRVTVGELDAKKLRLKSRLVASRTLTTGADGNASLQLKAVAASAKALKKLSRNVAFEVEALSGDRFSRVTGKLTK